MDALRVQIGVDLRDACTVTLAEQVHSFIAQSCAGCFQVGHYLRNIIALEVDSLRLQALSASYNSMAKVGAGCCAQQITVYPFKRLADFRAIQHNQAIHTTIAYGYNIVVSE